MAILNYLLGLQEPQTSPGKPIEGKQFCLPSSKISIGEKRAEKFQGEGGKNEF